MYLFEFINKQPNSDLDNGLKQLVTDQDVLELMKLVSMYKVIDLYVDHCPNEEPLDVKPLVVDDSLVENLDDNVEVSDDEWLTRCLELAPRKKQSVDENEGVGHSHSDENMSSDSERDDASGEASSGEDGYGEDGSGEDSDDSDYFVEVENMIDDVEVDMAEFKKYTDDNVEWIGKDTDLGDMEGDDEVFKEMLTRVSVEQRRELFLKKNDKIRLRAECRGKVPQFSCEDQSSSKGKGSLGPKGSKGKGQMSGSDKDGTCPWYLQCSKLINQETWAVKTFNDTHKCLQTRKVKRCTTTFLSKSAEAKIKPNPKIPVGALKDHLQKQFEIGISSQKVHRAKKKAMERIYGNHRKQYAQLRDYCLELKNSNPNTTVHIEVERPHDVTSPERKFKRVYVCLGPLKDGFKAGKRELLGLDGCFLSGMYPGWILTAVGVDPNNGIYPLAYAIVESENKDSWKWFLNCVGDDLDLFRNSNFTFISDRQKGVIPAIAETFPCAEHRYCLKHIYENMKLNWRGQLYKQMLWRCAAATTVQYFDKQMEKLKAFKKEAYEWLKKIPPQHWSRSHFSGRAHCDVLLSNMCEVLNRQLVDGRDKPIITCLEFIRVYLMKRIVNVQKVIAKSDGPLTPAATRIFQTIVKDAAQIKIEWNGGDLYQANDPNGLQCMVNMRVRQCSCRRWELTGIPYKHAVATIWNMASNGEETGIPESYCHQTYWLDTWKEMYRFKINPLNGHDFWQKSNNLNTIIPPDPKPQIGRPQKKRKKSAAELFEGLVKGNKLSKAGRSITCSICKVYGHNKKVCPSLASARATSSAQATAQASARATSSAQATAQASARATSSVQASEIPISSQAPPATQFTQSPTKLTKLTAKRRMRPE